MIQINDDDTISVNKKKASLFAIMAAGNVINANKLGKAELWAVALCAKNLPYGGQEAYAKALELVKEGKCPMSAAWLSSTLGECRQAIVEKCGDSCNGPWDTYLTLAAKTA